MVRVQVANVAPQISGQIVDVRTYDNQHVYKGDVLYIVEKFDFAVALDNAKATILNREADLAVKKAQNARRAALTTLSTSIEEKQVFDGNAKMAEAAVASAKAALAQAEINLQRTEVRSPVDGYVTNLLMRVGDYARAGTSNVSVIDENSYWIDAYFEETKLVNVHVGGIPRSVDSGATWAPTIDVDADVHEVKDHSVAAFRSQLTETRKRLGDRLAVYHVHSATLDTGVLEDVELHQALAELRETGVRIGVSTSGPDQAGAVRRAVAVRIGGQPLFTSVQSTWNLLETSAACATSPTRA
jgi:RND family efflux transporter MFP subunit